MKSLFFYIAVSLVIMAVAATPDIATWRYTKSLADDAGKVELATRPTPPIGPPTGQASMSAKDMD